MSMLKKTARFFKNLINPHPTRDWYIALAIAVLVAISLAALAVYLFIGIQAGFIVGPQGVSQPAVPTISRDAIQDTLETYTEREVNFAEENYLVPSATDPSR